MPARTGEEYIENLSQQDIEVWIEGERVVGDVPDHAPFQNIAKSVGHLYDMQHIPEMQDLMTYTSPTSGEPVGTTFLQPKSKADLAKRSRMMKAWADYSGGMLGRSPDYLNAAVMAMAGAADYFGQADPQFADNIRNYYQYMRENDLTLTHTLINPQVNRSKGAAEQEDKYLTARIVRETDEGIIIRGARMLATLGPLAEEILVFPSTLLKRDPSYEPYAFAIALPTSTPGLKFICRESFDYGRSHFDHPLGSRFDEHDAMVVFEDVLVPWDRVFMLRNYELCNNIFGETHAIVHMAHQVVAKTVAKAEFLLGIACKMADTIGIDKFTHVKEKMGKMMMYVESMRACLRASEADAQMDKWGLMCPDFRPLNAARNASPRIYPEMASIIKKLGASGMMGIPTEADLDGPIGSTIQRYYQGRNADAEERIKLFRLAWDAVMSAFGARQTHYEYYFFGDPVRMAGTLYESYDKEPLMERVDAFLDDAESNMQVEAFREAGAGEAAAAGGQD